MCRYFWLGIMLLGLVGCASPQYANLAFSNVPVDPGGDFSWRLKVVEAARAEHRNMPIRVNCISSCALELAAGPGVCLAPYVVIGVHEVRIVRAGARYADGVRNEALTQVFMQMIPTCARDLFLARGGWRDGTVVLATGVEILAACPQIHMCT